MHKIKATLLAAVLVGLGARTASATGEPTPWPASWSCGNAFNSPSFCLKLTHNGPGGTVAPLEVTAPLAGRLVYVHAIKGTSLFVTENDPNNPNDPNTVTLRVYNQGSGKSAVFSSLSSAAIWSDSLVDDGGEFFAHIGSKSGVYAENTGGGNAFTGLGNLYVSGTVTSGSAPDLKFSLQPMLGGVLPKLRAVTPITYAWKDPKKPGLHAGFSALDLQATFPLAVVANLTDGTLAIDHGAIMAYLWKAIAEADEKAEKLEARVKALEAVEKRIAQLEAAVQP